LRLAFETLSEINFIIRQTIQLAICRGVAMPNDFTERRLGSCESAGVRDSDRPAANGVQRKELKVIPFIEPRALEYFYREARARSQGQGINDQLFHRVDPIGVRFVVEQMDEAIARLEDIDVARDRSLRFR